MKWTRWVGLAVTLCFIVSSTGLAARLTDVDAGGSVGDAPDSQSPDQGLKVSLDFRNVDVRVVAKFISEITGKNFIFDNQVRDKITVYSPTKVAPAEAYDLFETVLKLHGYTTVPKGDLILIMPSQEARTSDVETRAEPPGPREATEDRVVTQLIRLKHADAAAMRALLQPLMGKTGILMSYDGGNTLIVTDYASNINRLQKILAAVDVPDEGTQLSVIKLQYASARDLAEELQQILREPAAAQGRPQRAGGLGYTVVPDERTNSLLVMARKSEAEIIRNIARKLDVPSPRGSDRVHVYFLENAVAEDLSKTLNELTGQAMQQQQQGGQGGARAPVMLQEPVFITAEKATNALIIRAERQDYLVIKNIIEQLDIQRAQVLVEGVVMEVTMKKANALGAEWRVLDFPEEDSNEISPFGGTNLPTGTGQGLINQMMANPFAGPSGMVLGAAQGTLTWGGTTLLNIGALIQALESDSDVNILSTPHLLTMDNEEARIIVGEERPFLKSSMATDTGAANPSITKTFEFKDLGLTLKLTPHITQGEYIKLKIFQELKNFISEAETGAINSTKRETETTVQVRNGETVVIGGMIGDERRQSRNKVPCLGSIPAVGWAFKTRNQSSDKLNLLILIRPTIIRTAEQLEALSRKKQQEAEAASDPDAREQKFPYEGLKILVDD